MQGRIWLCIVYIIISSKQRKQQEIFYDNMSSRKYNPLPKSPFNSSATTEDTMKSIPDPNEQSKTITEVNITP